jgi:hypothetical protein
MKAVARLIFTSLSTSEWASIVGATAVIGLLMGALNGVLNGSLLPSELLWKTLEFSVLGGVFMGSMYLPSTYSRLAHSHTIDLLPHGRLKLLASALLTILMVAAPIPVAIIDVMKTAGSYGLANVAYYGRGFSLRDYVQAPFFWYLFAIAVLGYTWVYIVIWSAASIGTHNMAAMIRTLFLMFAPVPFVISYRTAFSNASAATLAILIAAIWGQFALHFLLLLRLRAVTETRLRVAMLLQSIRLRASNISGRETQLVLGLRHPVAYALGITVISLMLLSSTKVNNGWLLYLTIAGVFSGGLPANVAANARVLWLRRQGSRAQIFREVEGLLWRIVAFRVAAVAAWSVLLGRYASFSWPFIACGTLHLAVSTIASIYLGLIQTGERRWTDAVVVVFTFAVAATGAAAGAGDLIGVPILTAILAALTAAYRFIAKQRWADLDWLLCRPTRVA